MRRCPVLRTVRRSADSSGAGLQAQLSICTVCVPGACSCRTQSGAARATDDRKTSPVLSPQRRPAAVAEPAAPPAPPAPPAVSASPPVWPWSQSAPGGLVCCDWRDVSLSIMTCLRLSAGSAVCSDTPQLFDAQFLVEAWRSPRRGRDARCADRHHCLVPCRRRPEFRSFAVSTALCPRWTNLS